MQIKKKKLIKPGFKAKIFFVTANNLNIFNISNNRLEIFSLINHILVFHSVMALPYNMQKSMKHNNTF